MAQLVGVEEVAVVVTTEVVESTAEEVWTIQEEDNIVFELKENATAKKNKI